MFWKRYVNYNKKSTKKTPVGCFDAIRMRDAPQDARRHNGPSAIDLLCASIFTISFL